MENFILNIRSASQIALLGAVTKNLRAVTIIHNENKLLINFYYEKIDEEDKEIPEIVATEMLSYFEDYDISVSSKILSLSEPIPIEGVRVFSRHV